MIRKIGVTKEWPDVVFVMYGTNELSNVEYSIPCENTNGFNRPIISGQDIKMTYEAIQNCFNQIGIKTEWNLSGKWVSPGEFEIYIPAKIE